MTATGLPARDPELPHLALALDTEQMRQEFGRRLDRGDCRIASCEILRVRHKPGTNAMICYRVHIHDACSEDKRTQVLTARLYPRGQSRERFRKASAGTLSAPACGPPLMHLEPMGMLVWAYPNDRKLTGMAVLDDENALRETVLPPVVAAHWEKSTAIVSLTREIVHYVPEHGLMVRVDLELIEPSGRQCSWQIFGKHYTGGQGEQTFLTMQKLWASTARAAGALTIAQPLAYQPKHQILWQEALDGSTLVDVADLAGRMSQAGAAVAALHQSEIAVARELRLGDWIERLSQAKETLQRAHPQVTSRLDATVTCLLRRSSELSGYHPAILHADLHPKNMLATANGIALIDLDNVASGPPLADVGSMCASLYAGALLDGSDPARVQAAVAQFVAAYRANTANAVPDFDLGWHTAVALIVERAYRCITRAKAGRIGSVSKLIEMADHLSRNGGAVAATEAAHV